MDLSGKSGVQNIFENDYDDAGPWKIYPTIKPNPHSRFHKRLTPTYIVVMKKNYTLVGRNYK